MSGISHTFERRALTNAKKEEVIERLLEAWKQDPNLRLGQFLVNAVGKDPFYLEDYDLVEQAERFAKREKKR